MSNAVIGPLVLSKDDTNALALILGSTKAKSIKSLLSRLIREERKRLKANGAIDAYIESLKR